jgi:hypothetical protein
MPTWCHLDVRVLVMRTKTLRPYDQGALLLLPPSVRDWVDPDGLAASLGDLVEERRGCPLVMESRLGAVRT